MPYNETSNMINKMNAEKKGSVNENSTMDDNYLWAASATDMTGLAPTVAHNEYEAANYEEIYPYLPPILPNSVITVPDTPMAEGIQSQMRRRVTPQNQEDKKKDS